MLLKGGLDSYKAGKELLQGDSYTRQPGSCYLQGADSYKADRELLLKGGLDSYKAGKELLLTGGLMYKAARELLATYRETHTRQTGSCYLQGS